MTATESNSLIWRHQSNEYVFEWDVRSDRAQLRRDLDAALIWEGSLLPLFWLKLDGDKLKCVKLSLPNGGSVSQEDSISLKLVLGDVASGELHVTKMPHGIRFQKLVLQWSITPVPAIIGMYFGASPLTPAQRDIVPSLEVPFWPDWSCEGFCIPSAKGAPIQSFFRRWDFGHATIPLGSFGPSLGTPYAAAYPRPLLAAAMGSDAGWLSVGPGAMPDAALSVQIRSATAMLHWLYREDLWGMESASREWNEPLRLCWAGTALESYQHLFQTFEIAPQTPAAHQRSSVNSWGSFKIGDFDIRKIADRSADDIAAEILVIDDLWETFNGSGMPALFRFPRFDADLQYARSKGLKLGFWQSVGWVDDWSAVGLTHDDVLCGPDGIPRRANWAMSPHLSGPVHYCLDPSSPKVREFLRTRTQRIMRQFEPALLKLDFGYGLPGPDVAVARDRRLRGERMGFELTRLITDAAKEINPNVTIQYYGIHPLMSRVTDIVALDDLGDAGIWEASGHAEWSIWATLVGSTGTAIMASSGYNWNDDEEILLNTLVIGAPGCVLPLKAATDQALSPARLLHRRALSCWHRRTTQWRPLWLDSEPGRINAAPHLACWGRLETFQGREYLTALALRMTELRHAPPSQLGVDGWEGRWGLIAQDDRSIQSSSQLACIPMDAGWIELDMEFPNPRVAAVTMEGEAPASEARVDQNKIRIEVSPERIHQIQGYLVTRPPN